MNDIIAFIFTYTLSSYLELRELFTTDSTSAGDSPHANYAASDRSGIKPFPSSVFHPYISPLVLMNQNAVILQRVGHIHGRTIINL